MKKRKKVEVRRWPIGIRVMAGHKTPPQAYLIYDILYSDGSRTSETGSSVHSIPNFNDLNPPRGKKWRAKIALALRPDLNTTIHAAAMLLNDIELACLRADGQ